MDREGGNDDDYGYIDYGPTSSSKNSGKRRVKIAEDSDIGQWQARTPDLSGIGGTIYFKVCEERENDPDFCSNVGGYEKERWSGRSWVPRRAMIPTRCPARPATTPR